MTHQSIPEIYFNQAQKRPGKLALAWRRDGYDYHDFSYQTLWESVLKLAFGLKQIGLQRKSKICIWSSNRPEWLISDIASQLLGASTVPIYTTLSGKEIAYIIKDSAARILVVENLKVFENLRPFLPELDQLWGVILIDDEPPEDNKSKIQFFMFKDLSLDKQLDDVEGTLNTLNPKDIASIIYTSGTTGFPKGVLLTHSNFISNIEHIPDCLPITSADRHLSFLPLSHVFERTCGSYLMGYCGATIIYGNGVEKVVEDAKIFKPTFLMAVPRFYEKVMIAIESKMAAASNLKKKLIAFANKTAFHHYSNKHQTHFDKLKFYLANKLIYKKFNQALGGELRFGVSGGAPLKPEIGEFFLGIGIQVLEGYGLTETSPVIALNRVDRFRFGSVGIPISIANVTITEDGEIATSGPCVMQGYHRRPEETSKVMEKGLFRTGDLGKIDSDGFLWITGRKKDLIVLSGGKKVCPTAIESIIENSEYILRCVLYGESKNFLSALIVPNFELIDQKVADFKGISPKDLVINKKFMGWLEKELEITQQNLARFECIKKFVLLEEDFSMESGELTPTLKLKRNVVWDKYSEQLNALYD